jgi:hypothetical protein
MILRTLDENDKALLAEWIAAEPDHSNSTPDFYYTPGTKTILYSDEQGPVCVVRYSSSLRLDIDFSPTAGKDRIKKMLSANLPEVVNQAKAQGFSELVFDSTSKALIRFCEKLGFTVCPDYRKTF